MNARYLLLTPGLEGADGIARVSRLVVRALAPSSGEAPSASVEVLSMGDPPALPDARLRLPGVSFSGAHGVKLRFVASALRAAVRGVERPEIICLHLGLSPVARLLARRHARLTIFLHGIEAWRPATRMERGALLRADTIMANSEHTARRFGEANRGFGDRSIRVCRLGVEDCGERPEARPARGVEWQRPGSFALIVGRMAAAERYKGHDPLIDIWRRVSEEVPEARLVVAGDGDDRARLEAKARALGDRIRFAGRVSDRELAALYRQCAFFVMPSRDEGFGLVFLEAMRAGKACVGGVGAASEIIEDGITGFIVDPGDPEQMLKAILRLLQEPQMRERMGRAGAERVAREFTEAHFRRRFRALLGLEPDAP